MIRPDLIFIDMEMGEVGKGGETASRNDVHFLCTLLLIWLCAIGLIYKHSHYSFNEKINKQFFFVHLNSLFENQIKEMTIGKWNDVD